MNDIAIRVEGLGKRYRIGAKQQGYKTLREKVNDAALRPFRAIKSLASRNGNPSSTRHPTPDNLFWALKDICFEVKRGEVVGIIGRNGAGKSTLLKALCRITEPTEGYADISGKVGCLLEVGTGFHPELTGRENIYLNGAILGMKGRAIERKFDEIVEFAEVQRFIDTPVKHYSSGMYLRLAFGVAAHLEPEILIVDEVLAVGDAAFQTKCLDKMKDVSVSGRTVLFVSHNMGAIAQLCHKGILLNEGRIAYEGTSDAAVQAYLESVGSHSEAQKTFEVRADTPVQLISLHAANSSGDAVGRFDIADDICLRLRYVVRKWSHGLNLHIVLFRNGTEVLCSFDTDSDPGLLIERRPGDHDCLIVLPKRTLKAGLYSVTVGYGLVNHGTLENHREAIAFRIEELSEDTSMRGYSEARVGVLLGPLQWRPTYNHN